MLIFLYMFFLFVLLIMLFSFLIASFLKKNGVEVDVIWLRLKVFYYLHQYKRLTVLRTGKIGVLYYFWMFSFIGLLGTIILYLS
jgi:hypothetical protein